MLAAGPDRAAALLGQNEVASYVTSVERMASFITKQEADARGWIKEAGKLSVALAALAERKATVQALANALDKLRQN